MSSQALYLKWRPLTFDNVVGQEHITYTLRNALISERVGHAYLFSGPRGTGKTTMARLLAKAVNCLDEDPAARPCNACLHCIAVNEARFLDLIEIDAASHTGVDDVRELRERIAYSPGEGRYKIYIVDEVHRFSGAAFDALLKTIEEPPEHAIFVLATTEIHKVPQTIQSRCQRFDFRRLGLAEIIERLRLILDHEGVTAEALALELVARQATGSMRDAISLLDQLIVEPGQMLTLELAQAVLGTANYEAILALIDALIAGNSAAGLDLVNRVIDQGGDPRQFALQTVTHLRHLILVQTGGFELVQAEVMPDMQAVLEGQAQQIPPGALLEIIRIFNEAVSDTRGGWHPQLPMELAFLKSVEHLHAPPPPELQTYPHNINPAPVEASGPAYTSRSAGNPRPTNGQPEPATITAGAIQSRWHEVLNVARRLDPSGMIQALLRSGNVYKVEGSTVILLMPGDVLCAKIEDEKNQAVIQQAFETVFEQMLVVRCQVQSNPSGPARAGNDVEALLADDSVVLFAINELGGQVTHIEESEE
nr:DNA polymerase III subunit gamma/tau [Anaerolineae bacterium]